MAGKVDQKSKFRPIILAKDGSKSAAHLLSELTLIMSQPGMKELVGVVKLNDGLFKVDMSAPSITHGLNAVREVTDAHFGIFIDTKSGDVAGTLRNYGDCFRAFAPANILTVSAIIATQGFMEFRKALPGVLLALFSVPTDMSKEECLGRYGMLPAEKISSDAWFFYNEWRTVCEQNGVRQTGIFAKPFDLIVSAPGDLDYLNQEGLGEHFQWVTPNIRDRWMAKDHQDAERGMGVYDALQKGTRYVVMGTQLLKGNPANGISAEQSQKLTLTEINRFIAGNK